MRILIALAAIATSATLFAGSATTAFASTPGYRLVPETAISGNSVTPIPAPTICTSVASELASSTSRATAACIAQNDSA